MSWKSNKQKSVSLKTAAAEWYVSSEAGKEIVYLCIILNDFGFEQVSPTLLYEDSRVVIVMDENPVNRKASRHIDTRKHLHIFYLISKDPMTQYLWRIEKSFCNDNFRIHFLLYFLTPDRTMMHHCVVSLSLCVCVRMWTCTRMLSFTHPFLLSFSDSLTDIHTHSGTEQNYRYQATTKL